MAIEAELPTAEEVADTESNFLSKPGTYHFAVMHADENPTYRGGESKGKLMDGFEIEAAVQAGSEKGKSHRFFIRNPNLSHRDQGQFCKALRGKWLEAIAVVGPAQWGKTVTIELVDSQGNVVVRGRQFIASMSPSKDNPKYLDLDGAKVWHPDDESADKCERNQEALKLRPKAHCRDPKSFVKQDSKAAGNGSGGNKAPANQPAGAGATAAAGVDMNDI